MNNYTKIFLESSLLLLSISAYADNCLSNNDISNFIKDKSSEELNRGQIPGPNGWTLEAGGGCSTNKFQDFARAVATLKIGIGVRQYEISCKYDTVPSKPGCSSELSFIKKISKTFKENPAWVGNESGSSYACGEGYSFATSPEQCSW